MVSYSDGKEINSCRNWNPTGDDLVADDWVFSFSLPYTVLTGVAAPVHKKGDIIHGIN